MATPFLTGTNVEKVDRLQDDDYLLEHESEFRNRTKQGASSVKRLKNQLPRVCLLYKTMKNRKKLVDTKKMNFLKIRDYVEDVREPDETGLNVRPGVSFWGYLAEANPQIARPALWVPHTYVNIGSNSQYWMWTDPETGRVCCKSDANYSDFERQIEKNKGLYAEKYYDEHERKRIENERKKLYFVAYRRYISNYETNTDVHSVEKWTQVRSSSSGLKDNSLVQEFIFPQGKNVSMTRLVFHTKHNKKLEANFAYKLRNKTTLVNEGDNQDKKSVRERTTINKYQDGTYTTNKMTGPGLFSLENSAVKLVDYLERCYPVRIYRIVIDFITGVDKRNYMFNVAHIEKEETRKTQDDKAEKKRTLDELTCSVYCKLCGLIFKKDEASKTLTYKLLWELSQHLKKRGRNLSDIEVSHSSTRPCRVCDLCYMVVVSEHELIELEQQFARAQNIPIKDPYLRVPIEKKAKNRPALLSEVLKQWRFMLYLEYLYFEAEDNHLFEELGVNMGSIHLQIKLFNVKNDFTLDLKPIELDKDKDLRAINWKGRLVYKINLLRVYYFFSEALDIAKFLNESDIYIRLTYSKDWNNYIAHGSSKTLSNFQNSRERGQKHESRIYLFFDNAKYCTLKVMSGLVCDGDFNTASMNLHKFNGIYFPDEDFYNCNMFPEEWIEVFHTSEGGRQGLGEDGEEDLYVDDLNTNDAKIQPYTPICTKAELKKMLEGDVKKVPSSVEAKTDNNLDVAALRQRLKAFQENNPGRPYSRYAEIEGSQKQGQDFRIGKNKRPMTGVPQSSAKNQKNRIQSSVNKPSQIENFQEIDEGYQEEIQKIINDNKYMYEEEDEADGDSSESSDYHSGARARMGLKNKDIGTDNMNHDKFLEEKMTKLEKELEINN